MPNVLQITDLNADNPLAQAPSWADAAQSVGGTVSSGVDALGQWLAAQRAKSAQMGLWNDQTGLPTAKGLVSAAQQTGNALLIGTTAPGIRAFHGSPYDFERFDTSKIGTGEGAQAYGHGLYMAENEAVARGYRDELAGFKLAFPTKVSQDLYSALPQAHQDIIQRMLQNGAQPAEVRAFLQNLAGGAQSQAEYVAAGGRRSANYGPDEAATADAASRLAASKALPKSVSAGRMYEVNIGADPEQFLHWDKPLSEQSPYVQDAIRKAGLKPTEPELGSFGGVPVRGAPRWADTPEAAQALLDAGIPGIRYLDQGSRGVPPTSYQIRSKDFTSGVFDNRALLEKQLPGYQKQFPDAQIHEIQNSQTHNYVVFDANTIDILRKYGLAGLGLGLGAAATNGSQQPPMAQ